MQPPAIPQIRLDADVVIVSSGFQVLHSGTAASNDTPVFLPSSPIVKNDTLDAMLSCLDDTTAANLGVVSPLYCESDNLSCHASRPGMDGMNHYSAVSVQAVGTARP